MPYPTAVLLSIFSDAQNIISIITPIIDIFAIVMIAVTVCTTILPLIKSLVTLSLPFADKSSSHRGRQAATENYLLSRRMLKENFIKGLLLALELESANAILKIVVFTSSLVGICTTSSTSTFSINNFIFLWAYFQLE